MEDISLFMLDLVQNSIRAGAGHVKVRVYENKDDYLLFSIEDDGCGMTEEQLQGVRDPFFTTRTTRKVGMGLALLDMLTRQCDGKMEINSRKGEGTELKASFRADSWDLPPMGDIAGSVKVMQAGAPEVDFDFVYVSKSGGELHYSTKILKELLGGFAAMNDLRIVQFLDSYLQEGMAACNAGKVVSLTGEG